ncbi:hypothetical protein J5N97_012002 [Dioscorea zingiberensis]|uniref:non-specific serine/threonine protein kinase n=1 Tax=Dioscorea zingiberensis TaxID=325984 RepID=A0A9D5CMZ7_9LILI|nr:hypothetical protein J5N97_012002 [Dioscorea zingiberensis]
MSLAVTDGADDGAAQQEPPDPDIREKDPTGRYICYKEVLGRGAFKTVYKAFDEVDGIEVAWNQVEIDDVVKSPKDLEQLYSEVHLLKTVKHENIIKFHTSWIDDQKLTVNIITELFTSGNLRQYRKKHKTVDMKAVKRWARQILMGLDYLHSHQPPIIHRDLKCDNIFINGNHGEVKIGDFGFAMLMQQSHARSVHGTPEFMAPELYDEDYNELVDIYSFGMCMLEMVTFEYPYCECINNAQIYKRFLILSHVLLHIPNIIDCLGDKACFTFQSKRSRSEGFIEKCLVPAAQRLPAKELLKDPFLQLNEKPEVKPSLLHTTDKKDEQQSVHPVVNENEPTVINIIKGATKDGSHLVTLEMLGRREGLECRLTGEWKEDDSVSLLLRRQEWGGDAVGVKNIHFPFLLDKDSSLSVAVEMVEQLQMPESDISALDGNQNLKDKLKDLHLVGYVDNSVGSSAKTPDASLNNALPCNNETSSNGTSQSMHDVPATARLMETKLPVWCGHHYEDTKQVVSYQCKQVMGGMSTATDEESLMLDPLK